MIQLQTYRERGRTRYECPVRGCSCVMRETAPDTLALHPDAATHRCPDWDCWGCAWIVDGQVQRVLADAPTESARRRKALRWTDGD